MAARFTDVVDLDWSVQQIIVKFYLFTTPTQHKTTDNKKDTQNI